MHACTHARMHARTPVDTTYSHLLSPTSSRCLCNPPRPTPNTSNAIAANTQQSTRSASRSMSRSTSESRSLCYTSGMPSHFHLASSALGCWSCQSSASPSLPCSLCLSPAQSISLLAATDVCAMRSSGRGFACMHDGTAFIFPLCDRPVALNRPMVKRRSVDSLFLPLYDRAYNHSRSFLRGLMGGGAVGRRGRLRVTHDVTEPPRGY